MLYVNDVQQKPLHDEFVCLSTVLQTKHETREREVPT